MKSDVEMSITCLYYESWHVNIKLVSASLETID